MTNKVRKRDEEFARRLNEVCNEPPRIPPYNRGRGEWIRKNMEMLLGNKLSAESVSNWFNGQARPRPDKMKALAQLLRVDEAWLSLGVTPELSVEQRAERSIHAGGAVNFVAGLVQLGGGTIAFIDPPALESAYADFFAILKGKAHLVKVSFGVLAKSEVKFAAPNEHDRIRVIALLKDDTGRYHLYEIPSKVSAKHGRPTGGYIEVVATRKGDNLVVGKTELPAIRDFDSYSFAA